MDPSRPASHDLREEFRLTGTRPAFGAGLRAGIGLAVPVFIGLFTGHLVGGTYVAMGCWFALLVDIGGTRFQKARAMFAGIAASALAVLVGGSVKSVPGLAPLATFGWVFAGGFASLFGSTAAQVSFIASLVFVIAVGVTVPANALFQSGLYLAGGAWATLLSIGFWTIHPNQPVREAVAKLYTALAAHLRNGMTAAQQACDETWWGTQSLSGFTQQLETARQLWETVRTKRNGLTESERELLIALENARLMVRSVVAYVETVAVAVREDPELRDPLLQLTTAFTATSRRLADSILTRKSPGPLNEMDSAPGALNRMLDERRAEDYAEPDGYRKLLSLGKVTRQASLMAGQFRRIAEILGQPERIRLEPATATAATSAALTTSPDVRQILRANLTFRSTALRHALRVALLTAGGQILGFVLPWSRGYWVPLSVLVVLKPDYGGTISRAIQRVIGTIVGGLIAAGLAAGVRESEFQGFLIGGLAFAAFSVKPLNFGIYTIALTPLFMVMLNLLDKGDWQVTLLRIADTAIGGGLCLLGGYILLPDWERVRLPAQIAKAIRANLAYFQQVMALYIQRSGEPSGMEAVHRAAELENANASAAAQRLAAEPSHKRGDAASWVTAIVYLRGLTNSIMTLAEHAREISGAKPLPGLVEVTNAICRALEDLAGRMENRQVASAPFQLDRDFARLRAEVDRLHVTRMEERAFDPSGLTPTLTAVRENTFLSIELDQVINKVNVLRDAVERLTAEGRQACDRSQDSGVRIQEPNSGQESGARSRESEGRIQR